MDTWNYHGKNWSFIVLGISRWSTELMWKSHIAQLRQMDDSPQQEQPTNSDKETMIHFPLNQMANDTEPVNDEPSPAVNDSTASIHRYLRREHVLPE